jgi:peptidoglycan L-alanyl-D-glutamate endopeptidase CwlK
LTVLDARSEKNLTGVHPALVAVAVLAHRRLEEGGSGLSFIVTEGLRTQERQAMLVRAGASQTMNSKHLVGRAFDVAVTIGGDVHWDQPLYGRIAESMKQTAADLGVQLVWGGDWKTFTDGPHFELADQTYSA